jgi:tetratricopeptide (TPR) repeat protein
MNRTEIDGATRNRANRLLPYFIPASILVPRTVWIFFDRYPFGGDESHYGTNAIHLFYLLSHSPSDWISEMFRTLGFKAPGIVWLGQFFVPVGLLINSIDDGLVLSVLVFAYMTLVLTHKTLSRVANNNPNYGLLGCFIIASAPLSLDLWNDFLVEPLQIFSVSYFLFILVSVKKWTRVMTLSHLLLATGIAMAAKATSPLFCLVPGLLSFLYCVWPSRSRRPWNFFERRTLFLLIPAIVIFLITAGWYHQNFYAVKSFVRAASSGTISVPWGKIDTFTNTFLYWLGTVQLSFFLPTVLPFFLILWVAAIVVYISNQNRQFDPFTILACIAVVQIALILTVFSLNVIRTSRYLYASLPYFAVLICWSVKQLKNKKWIHLSILVFIFQFVILDASSWKLNPFGAGSVYVWPLHTRDHEKRMVEAIAKRTCPADKKQDYYNVIGIDPQLMGDWLAPWPVNYAQAKKRIKNEETTTCFYDYLGSDFFGADVNIAWNLMLTRKVQYFVTVNPHVYPTPSVVRNKALTRENFPILMKKITESGIFVEEAALAEDRGFLIYRRTNSVKYVRALLNLNHLDSAAAELETLPREKQGPVDAWVDLILKYEQLGQWKEAIHAARKGLAAAPDQFQLHYHLARLLKNRRRFSEAIQFANKAFQNARDSRERNEVKQLLAELYLRNGKTEEGCKLLSELSKENGNDDLLSQMEKNRCND